jgi:hypothetical protein
MQYRPYFLLSDTVRDQLRARFKVAIDEWSTLWLPESVRAVELGDEICASATLTAQAWQSCHPLRAGKKQLGWAQPSAKFLEALVDAGAGISLPQGKGGALSLRMGSKLYADLLARMLGVAPLGLEVEDATVSATPEHLFAPGGGGVRVTLRIGAASADVLIPSDIVASLAPGPARRARPGPKPMRIQSAISGARLRVRVAIDLPGGIAIEELEGLREGHVVVLDQPPSAAWDLYGADGARLGRCRPGRVGDQLVVKPLEAARPS